MNYYQSREDQASQLANLVASQLAANLDQHNKVVLIVAGGSTPKRFLNCLADTRLDWKNIVVIPSDERWVDSNSPRSNDGFIRDNLIVNQAVDASLVSLYVDNTQPDQALVELEQRLLQVSSYPAVCVLGMGQDAHFASLFPGAANLKAGLDPFSRTNIVAIQAPGADEPRVSLTLANIAKSQSIHLLICGGDKLSTLNQARSTNKVELMPIASLLDHPNLHIHYAD